MDQIKKLLENQGFQILNIGQSKRYYFAQIPKGYKIIKEQFKQVIRQNKEYDILVIDKSKILQLV